MHGLVVALRDVFEIENDFLDRIGHQEYVTINRAYPPVAIVAGIALILREQAFEESKFIGSKPCSEKAVTRHTRRVGCSPEELAKGLEGVPFSCSGFCLARMVACVLMEMAIVQPV